MMQFFSQPNSFINPQEESQIIYTNSIDGCVVVVADLLSLTMELDSTIEEQRIKLSENNLFFPELVFQYIKFYSHNRQEIQKARQDGEFTNFFDFESQLQVRMMEQNLINISKDGLILFKDVVNFLKDEIGYSTSELQIQNIEKIYHQKQHQISVISAQAQVYDANKIVYPLPTDVQAQITFEKQLRIEKTKETGVPTRRFLTTELVLNSGTGINYETFLKIFLSLSIPAAKNRALKRKLIYEADQTLKVNLEVRKIVASILKLEIELHMNSETLRLKLAQDSSYHALSLFQAMDIKRDNSVDYETLQQVMQRTQHSFKPSGFVALLRRARILSGQFGLFKDINALTFDDFNQLTQVRAAYYKRPNQMSQELQQRQNTSTVLMSGINNDHYQVHKVIGPQMNSMIGSNYSQILGTTVDRGQLVSSQSMANMSRVGSTILGNTVQNSKMRSINIDDLQPQSRIQQSPINKGKNLDKMFVESIVQGKTQANIPLYRTDNYNLNSIIRDQVQPINSYQIQQNDDFIIYGTKKDMQVIRHDLNSGFGSPQYLQQLEFQQKSGVSHNGGAHEQPLVRPSTNFDLPFYQQSGFTSQDKSLQQQADFIVGEAQYQQKLSILNQNVIDRELINAKHTNTKYQANIYSNTLQQQPNQGPYLNPPWRNIDRQTEENMKVLNRQMDDIKKFAGIPLDHPLVQPVTQKPVVPTTTQPVASTTTPVQPNAQSTVPIQSNVQSTVPIPVSTMMNLSQNGSPQKKNSGRHQIFGGLSNAQQPLLYADQNNNALLNYNFESRQQIQPTYDVNTK